MGWASASPPHSPVTQPAPTREESTSVAAAVPAPSLPTTPPASLEELWTRLLTLAAPNRRLRTLLDVAAPVSFAEATLAVYIPANTVTSFNSYLAEIEPLASQAACTPVRIRVEAPQVALTDEPTAQQRIAEHPLVKQAMELLNAKVVGVQARVQKPAP